MAMVEVVGRVGGVGGVGAGWGVGRWDGGRVVGDKWRAVAGGRWGRW